MGYGRFVGRVGALALALGIGLVAPAVAAADPADDTTAGGANADTASDRSETKDADPTATLSSDGPSHDTDDPAEDAASVDEAELDEAELDEAELDEAELDEAGLSEESGSWDPALSAADASSDLGDPEQSDDLAAAAELHADVDEESPNAEGGGVASRYGDGRIVATVDPLAAGETAGADKAPIADEVDIAAASQRSPLPVELPDAETASAQSHTAAASSAALSFSAPDLEPAAAIPKAAVVSTGLAGMVSKFLAVLGIGPSATGGGAPLPTFDFVTVVLGAISREIDRLFSNNGPTAAPSQSGQTGPGVVAGALNATDPEGDRLAYKVVQAPSRGSVVVDAAGNFTYTAGPDLTATGGADAFTVQVRDVGFHLISTSPTKTDVPVTVTIAAAPAPLRAVSSAPTTVVSENPQTLASASAALVAQQAISPVASQAMSTEASATDQASAPISPSMAVATAMTEDHQHPVSEGDFIALATFGDLHGSDHTGEEGLAGGRTAITTEALLAYNNLRQFAGLGPSTLDEVGSWAFANALTNNATAWGNDQQGVGLYYSMQGAKVGWIADDKYDPQIIADIQRTARLGSDQDVMAMVAQYGHSGFADYLTDNGFDQTFINTLKMEPHNAGWMHSRAHGRLSIENVATSHDVNHLTVLSHDQMQPFMNDTFDWPQWPALEVSNAGVLEYFQSMVVLGDPLGKNLSDLNGPPVQTDPDLGEQIDPDLGGGINSGNVGDELWGEAFFAAYVDMAGWPVPDLVKIAQDRGVSLLTLGFVQAAPDGSGAWGGYPSLTPGSSDSQAQSIDASIAAFKAAGGDVMISLGGASGTTLAQSHVERGLGAQDLADAYGAVADRYSLNRIDFDIEGAAVAEPASIALRS